MAFLIQRRRNGRWVTFKEYSVQSTDPRFVGEHMSEVIEDCAKANNDTVDNFRYKRLQET